MGSNHKMHDTLAKIGAMDPESCGLTDAIHLAREALASDSATSDDAVGVVTTGFVSAHGDWRQELVLSKKEFLPSGTQVFVHPAPATLQGEPVMFCLEFDGATLGRPTSNRQEAEEMAALIPGRRRVVSLFREAPAVQASDAEFKNFHRLLCERFEYGHDPVHWKRDQVSLIEWIARQCADSASGVPAERLADGRWKEIAEYQYALRQFPTTPEKGQGALDALAQQWPGFQVAVERHMEKLKAATKRTEFVRPPKNEFRSQAENAIDEGYHAQMDGLCLSDNPYVERCENWFLWRRGCLNAEKDEA